MSATKEISLSSNNEQTSVKVERLFMENNLLRIMGYLFCHDPRAAVKHTEPITDIDKILKKQISIEPNPNYGQPRPR